MPDVFLKIIESISRSLQHIFLQLKLLFLLQDVRNHYTVFKKSINPTIHQLEVQTRIQKCRMMIMLTCTITFPDGTRWLESTSEAFQPLWIAEAAVHFRGSLHNLCLLECQGLRGQALSCQCSQRGCHGDFHFVREHHAVPITPSRR